MNPASDKKHGARKHLPKGLMVVYEDPDLLVVDKPAGMLTMGTNREKVRTVYYALTNYVRKGNPKSRERVFIVHRLDRETSGVLVFARNEATKRALQERWERVRKEYLAVVEGVPAKPEGTIEGYLLEDASLRMRSTRDREAGKYAKTEYEVLAQSSDRALLAVSLQTGRKHQIRVHLAELGHPVLGDRKYGRAKSDIRRLALHALRITLTHPKTRERLMFSAEAPLDFVRLAPRRGGGRKCDTVRHGAEHGVEVSHHGRRRTRKKPHRRRAGSDPGRGEGSDSDRAPR